MKTTVLAWTFFILMGLFASVVVPLGEGFDEPFHLGVIQQRTSHLSVELERFLELHPIGWRLHEIYPELHSYEEYWQRPDSERLSDDAAIRELRLSPGRAAEGNRKYAEQYEGHQPEQYYRMSYPLFLAASQLVSLVDTFLFLRLWSVLLSSAVVPLAYLLARRITSSQSAATGVAMLTAMFPGIYPDIARISNDALAVPVAALIFLALARYYDSPSKSAAHFLGFALCLGLLTKAFFIPVLAATSILIFARKDWRTLTTIGLWSIPGWFWYGRNLFATGSLTGLPETVAAKTSLTSSLAALGQIHWVDMFRLAAVSHVWIGNFSLLQYRSWIYKIVFAMFAVGVIGFFAWLRKSSSPAMQALGFTYAMFGAALVYIATQVFQEAGISVIQGWYLSPFLPVEALLFVIGVHHLFPTRGARAFIGFVSFCFLAMSIYGTAFIEAPYYSGLTSHGPSGSLRAYHPQWADISAIGERLTRFHPWIPDAMPLILGISVLITGLFLIWSYASQSSSSSSSLS